MSTLPGRSGAIALSLSFAATFALVVSVAGTAADLAVVPARPASKVRPVPPPTVMPTVRPGLVVDGDGVARDGHRFGTADEVLADHGAVTEALRVDPSAGQVSTTIWVEPDGSPAAALAAAAAALEAGYQLVLVVADEPQRPYLACEITVAPTDAAIAAAEMSGSLAAACAAATAVAPEPDAA
jgi:hypothetical protein